MKLGVPIALLRGQERAAFCAFVNEIREENDELFVITSQTFRATGSKTNYMEKEHLPSTHHTPKASGQPSVFGNLSRESAKQNAQLICVATIRTC